MYQSQQNEKGPLRSRPRDKNSCAHVLLKNCSQRTQNGSGANLKLKQGPHTPAPSVRSYGSGLPLERQIPRNSALCACWLSAPYRHGASRRSRAYSEEGQCRPLEIKARALRTGNGKSKENTLLAINNG